MNEFLRSILFGINNVVGNYGWSIVVFTLLVRLVILPFDIKSRKGMRKSQALQPKIAELQAKYKNDQEKLNKKTMELYKKENVSMFSGCLPLLITMPILFAMFAALRMIANEQIAKQAFELIATGELPILEKWLWIKNIWVADSPFNSSMIAHNSMRMIPADMWQRVYEGLSPNILAGLKDTGIVFNFAKDSYSTTVEAIYGAMQALPAYQAQVQVVPGFQNFFMNMSLYKNFNGLFLLPLLSGASQIIMTKFTPQPTSPDPKAQQQQQAGGSFMKWFFPLFSVYICATSNAGFSIYWVTANIIVTIQNLLLTKILDAKENNDVVIQKEGVVK